MTTTATTFPKYISDITTEAGQACKHKHTRFTGGEVRGETWTVEDLHATMSQGVESTVFTGFGHLRGREAFGRERVIAYADGIAVYSCTGSLVQLHPLGKGRTVRLLVK